MRNKGQLSPDSHFLPPTDAYFLPPTLLIQTAPAPDDRGRVWRTVAATHLIIVGCFILVFFVVVVCNLLIARALLAQSPIQTRGSSSYMLRGVKGQALQMMCAVVGVFVVCFLPHHVVQGPWTLAVLEIKEGWGSMDWDQRTR
ncbi:unnamed protein product, partial [Coregonus sp. 'balchen']